MNMTFAEAKKQFPVGETINSFGDVVPSYAHDSLENMIHFLSIYVANNEVKYNEDTGVIEFEVYE
ncbi:hypothetical protein M2475_001619 [Breznakia sp. PF5-3]|uniref:hypothetical protein n=1 Tax=unclassified Breznakia TaxID=2623764 RepID=UPI002406ED95|nr:MULTISPECIES: hypothetical protein [unclassified Breznakia]MDF9825185.1 hypothetical protein [Breznakia sp. PM6-1]MDF9836043.1 hypothetical protein [Breznakia sp. PF5-3]MDF9838596.1 hypothetical protein [Breznakia sp. PFB2-8]MDF9860635.1 hypothetical protein [Breznakia sp. PH5-24]